MRLHHCLNMSPSRLVGVLMAAGLTMSAGGSQGLKAAEPTLFGSTEIRSERLTAFTKWTGMLARLRAESSLSATMSFVPAGDQLTELRAVNRMVNAVRYVPDEENWGTADHWSTPGEFYSQSGDCEDFAIAKYVALKELGFDPAKMRIVVLADEELSKHHAVLMVNTDMGRLILDNQNGEILHDTDIKHYRPIYSINEYAWWLHVARPQRKLVAQLNP